MRRFLAFLLLAGAAFSTAQAQLVNPLKHLLRRDTTAVVRRVLRAPSAYRVQILYTQIRRDELGRPTFKSYAYRLRPKEYFYPASTVKLPAAALALEKIRAINANCLFPALRQLTRESPLEIDSAFAGQTRVKTDDTAPGQRPTIGQYVRKVLLVSDNEAFNRLYEFVGQQELNEALQRQQRKRTRIIHRLSVGDKEPNARHTNPFLFFRDSLSFFSDSTITVRSFWQPAAHNEQPLPPLAARNYRIGNAYMAGDKRVDEPMDFSAKNFFPLAEQQQVLRALLFPAYVPARRRFGLAEDDYAFLRKYLSLPPRLSQYPKYDAKEYPDNYAKFLLVGGPPVALPEGVRIYNKIGQAYGFLIDNACIVDSLRGVEFLLSAVIYCNQDGVLNDDHYDYDTVGLPFLRRLGQLVYQHELTRTDERRRRQVRRYWSAAQERAEP